MHHDDPVPADAPPQIEDRDLNDQRPFGVNDDDAIVDAGSPQDYGDPNQDLVSPDAE